MTVITSRDNQKLKFARAIRDGREPDFIFIEGARLAEEVYNSDLEIQDVFISEAFQARDNTEIEVKWAKRCQVSVVTDRLFDSIADTKNPQGIIIIAKRPYATLVSIEGAVINRSGGVPIVIFLKEINNPSNLGAILRTAEAAGVMGVVVSGNSADAFSPKALRAAMGSSLRLYVVENADLNETLAWAGPIGLTPTAADTHGQESYTELDWKKPRLLIFGSEATGLNAKEREEIEEITYIPMASDVESLNLAVSCGIILFEAKRQIG